MSKQLKWVMLSLVMALPVFIFIFLHVFGDNHYRVQIFYPEEVIESTLNGKIQYDTIYHVLPDFHFVSQDGDSVTPKTLTDKILVSDFVFTRCPGPCPKMTNQLVRVQEAFKGTNDIRIISH
ncbi:MAG: SCO family protein, partial [Cytophagales bacterium]|nr:SCO family protein [Cytophagales bacterium]